MENEISKAIDTIAGFARAGMGPQKVDRGNVPYVLVPEGYKAQPLPELVFNEHTTAPERAKQSVTVFDAASFIEYHKLFADENSRSFADETKTSVLSILDYHGSGGGPQAAPRWGAHRLTLTLRASEEWKVWIGKNNASMTQQQFAEFLEQNSMDIENPSPAQMMEVATDLNAATDVEFGSGIRQADGSVKFKYTETVRASVGGGQVSVPERFSIAIPPFIGSEVIAMDALLRFRVKEGKLTFFYTLVRPEAVQRTAFAASVDAIEKALLITSIKGNPA